MDSIIETLRYDHADDTDEHQGGLIVVGPPQGVLVTNNAQPIKAARAGEAGDELSRQPSLSWL
jgi:hypothetical protein